MFQVPKSYSLNNQCEPSYSTLLQSGSGENGQVSPDKGRLYTNLPPPASSGNKLEFLCILCRTVLHIQHSFCTRRWEHRKLILCWLRSESVLLSLWCMMSGISVMQWNAQNTECQLQIMTT